MSEIQVFIIALALVCTGFVTICRYYFKYSVNSGRSKLAALGESLVVASGITLLVAFIANIILI